MLEHLIKKYKEKDVKEVVYRLSYAGKFIVIKGKTLCGSLIIIANTFEQYSKDTPRFKGHLYRHLYDHFLKNKDGRFRIKTLSKIDKKTTQYHLIKREQMELDKHRYNQLCLNNALEAYIPVYNEATGMFGWLEKTAVMSFKKWLGSKAREAYIKRYTVR